VLLVDDDVETHFVLEDLFAKDRFRFELHCVKTLRTARRLMKAEALDVLLVDRRLAGNDGQNLQAEISARYPYLPVIVMNDGPVAGELTEAWRSLDKTSLSFDVLSEVILFLHHQTNDRRKQREAWVFLSASIDALMDAVIIVDSDLQSILGNDEWVAKHGLDVNLSSWKTHLAGEAEGRVVLDGLDTLIAGSRSYFEHEMSLGAGRWVQVSMVAFFHEGRRFAVITESDVTEKRSLRSQVEDAKYRDSVTGLPSRSALLDVLKGTLEVGVPAVVLLININDFRSINHEYGYDGGDAALALVGQRIQGALNSNTFVARLGNDEFVVVIRGVLDRITADRFAADLILGMDAPIVLAGEEVVVSIRIGVSSPRIGMSAAETLRLAELAMLAAKRDSRNPWRHYDSSMRVLAVRSVHKHKELALAMSRKELFLSYEPIVDLASQKVVAVEAHLAWNHPIDGVQDAQKVTSLAQKCGMAEELAFWMIETLVAEEGRVLASFPYTERTFLPLSPDLVTLGAFAKVAGQSAAIAFQFRADVFLQPNAGLIDHIQALSSLGFPIWLDRFAGGDTSLFNLASLKFEGVKMDARFGRSKNPQEYAQILGSILAFCEQMQWNTVLMGLDEGDHRVWFADQGWSLGQGDFFGLPHPVEDLVAQHMIA
jgi:diguanylate cyclase (GGDEF)-like protein